jgi:putative transcriptional regulator
MDAIVANTIHAKRSESGWTQEELAERIGVTRQTIIAIEKGNYTPSVLLALKLSACFKVSVNDLFSIRHER